MGYIRDLPVEFVRKDIDAFTLQMKFVVAHLFPKKKVRMRKSRKQTRFHVYEAVFKQPHLTVTADPRC
mgnify:CR=1 FL=1